MIATTAYHGLIDVGIYTVQEAALYARVSTPLMMRWMGWSQGEGVISPQLGDETRLVSFLDFVQTLSVRAIRSRYDIPLPKIREAINKARDRWGIEYPFAERHKTFVFGDLVNAPNKANILIQPAAQYGKDLVQLTGKQRGNLVLRDVVEIHMQDLYFGDQNLATAYVAWKEDGRKIIMDPRKQFGDPVIEGTGYSAQALWHAHISEGGIEAAATAYGVDNKDIVLAIKYYDHLQGPSLLRDKEKIPV